MKRFLTGAMLLAAGPAMAAGDYPFFSLRNTDLIVLIAFVIFAGILYYFKVPGMITGLLDKRADDIRGELDEARRLREEALEVLAKFEKQHAGVQDQADRIVARAREDAQIAADQAKADMAASVERRIKAAQDQIASAEAAAVREVREKAARVAVAAAREVIAKKLSDDDRRALVASSIQTVDKQLH